MVSPAGAEPAEGTARRRPCNARATRTAWALASSAGSPANGVGDVGLEVELRDSVEARGLDVHPIPPRRLWAAARAPARVQRHLAGVGAGAARARAPA